MDSFEGECLYCRHNMGPREWPPKASDSGTDQMKVNCKHALSGGRRLYGCYHILFGTGGVSAEFDEHSRAFEMRLFTAANCNQLDSDTCAYALDGALCHQFVIVLILILIFRRIAAEIAEQIWAELQSEDGQAAAFEG